MLAQLRLPLLKNSNFHRQFLERLVCLCQPNTKPVDRIFVLLKVSRKRKRLRDKINEGLEYHE